MRRAQAEIIGLVLIVLLLAVGFLLYVKFSLSPDETPDAFGETQVGQTFVNSLAKATVTCEDSGQSLEDYVQDIARGTTRCDAEDAVEEYVNATLHATLDEWGHNYRLTFVRSGNGEGIGLANFTNAKIPPAQRCSTRMDRTADIYYVRLFPSPGDVLIRLETCA